MSYKALYDYCQTLTLPISRNTIRLKIEELCGEGVKIMCTGMDIQSMRGNFISATNQSHQFVKQSGGKNVVLVARGLSKQETRFIVVKEMMHMFDTPLERTNSSAELESLLTGMCQVEIEPPVSPQVEAEWACMLRAVGALCPETDRVAFLQQRDRQQITAAEIATKIKIPEYYVPFFFHARFKQLITLLSTR